jgi:hypothetical protein
MFFLVIIMFWWGERPKKNIFRKQILHCTPCFLFENFRSLTCIRSLWKGENHFGRPHSTLINCTNKYHHRYCRVSAYALISTLFSEYGVFPKTVFSTNTPPPPRKFSGVCKIVFIAFFVTLLNFFPTLLFKHKILRRMSIFWVPFHLSLIRINM